jgi:SAM-dependent methyltransferase
MSARIPGAPSRLFLRLRQRSLASVVPLFPTAGLIVDLGAGFGVLARGLVQAAPGRRVLAIDHDLPRVAWMRRALAGLPIEVRAGSLEEVALPDCEGVALIDVLHYFREFEQEALLGRVVQALKPGGTLVLRDPDAGAGVRFAFNRLHEALAIRSGFTRARLGHYRTAGAWRDALERRGLRVTLGPAPRGPYADRVVVGHCAGAAS